MKKHGKLLAFLLAFSLVTTTFGSDIATARVYAEEIEKVQEEDADSIFEPIAQTEEDAEAVEEKNEEEDAEAVEEPADEGSEESGEAGEEAAELSENLEGAAEAEEPADEGSEESGEAGEEAAEPSENLEADTDAGTEEPQGSEGQAVSDESDVNGGSEGDVSGEADENKEDRAEVKEDEETGSEADAANEEVTDGSSDMNNEETEVKEDEGDSSATASDAATEEITAEESEEDTEDTDEASLKSSILKEDKEAEDDNEQFVTVTYEATEGGSVSTESEEIDVNDDDAEFEGSTASADEGYVFDGWYDGDSFVTDDETLIPEDITEDTTFTAVFEEEETEMPAVTFRKSTGGISVYIDAPEGAFPEGTKVSVTPVYDSDILDAVKETVEQEINSEDSEVVKTVEKVVAVDISFSYDGDEIEPEKSITVKLTSSELADAEEAQVVHVDDSGDATIVDDVCISGSTAEFESDEFSIYGYVTVKEEDQEFFSRKYSFQDIDDTTGEYKSYYFVNEAGQMVDNQIIRNFENGNVLVAIDMPHHAGRTFEGWFLYENGSFGNKVEFGKPIDLSGLTENEEVIVRARYSDVFTVTYLDEKGSLIGKEFVEPDENAEGGSYHINKEYTPYSSTKEFVGWMPKEGADKIKTNEVSPYSNGTSIIISGNIVLQAVTSAGYWITFNENGAGATYTKPIFYKGGTITGNAPVDPSRKGYIFKGWYTGAPAETGGTPTGKEFNFATEKSLTEDIVLYAKWIPNDMAPFTINVWIANLKDPNTSEINYSFYKTYESYGSTSKKIGEQNIISLDKPKYEATVKCIKDKNAVDSDGNPILEDDTFYIVGFQPDKYDTDEMIKPEGTSVINLYFSRITYKIQFRFAQKVNGNSNSYGFVFNESKPLFYINDDAEGTIKKAFPKGYHESDDYYYLPVELEYGGDLASQWPGYELFENLEKAISGQTNTSTMVSWILMEGCEEKKNYHDKPGTGTNTVKGKIDTLHSRILKDWRKPDDPYLTARFDYDPKTYHYQIFVKKIEGVDSINRKGEKVDESKPENVEQYNGELYYKYDSVDVRSCSDYTGQHAPSYEGFHYIDGSMTYDATIQGTDREVVFFYSRETNCIIYNDGVYVDSVGNRVEGYNNQGQLKVSKPITVNARAIDPEGDYAPNAQVGFFFDAWYEDPGCSVKVDLNQKIMVKEGIQVYAKWILKQYIVILNPNLPESSQAGVQWTESGRQSGSTVDYGSKTGPIADAIHPDYEMRGWYLDKYCTKPFNAGAYTLNDITVTESYTDPDRKWITGKLNLYAGWRRESDKADIFKIEYDVNLNNPETDMITVTDNNSYEEKDSVKAQNNTAALPENKQFKYWVLQKYDEASKRFVDTTITVKEGNTFTIARKYAMQDLSIINSASNGKGKSFVIRLRAEYGEGKDSIEVTKIIYDGNGTTDAPAKTTRQSDTDKYIAVANDGKTVTYSNVQLNSVHIIGNQGFVRTGYKLLGWANGKASKEAGTIDFVAGDKVGADNLDPDENTLYAIWEKNEYLAYWQVETYYQKEDGSFGKPVIDTVKYPPLEVKLDDFNYDTLKKVEVPADERTATTTKDGVDYYISNDLGIYSGELSKTGHTKNNPLTLKVYYLRKSLGDQLVVKAQDNTKRYDATPIDNGNLPAILTMNDTALSGDASDPYELVDVTFDGEITNVKDNGKGANRITSYVIRDTKTGTLYTWASADENNPAKASGNKVIEVKDGKVIEGESLRFISVVNGDLSITPRTVILTPENAEKTYDGQIYPVEQYSKDGHKITYADEYAAVDGVTYEFDNTVAIKGIKGVVESAPEGEITIDKYSVSIRVGDELVKPGTDNVVVITRTADLKINPRNVKLKSDSFEKYYDGKPLVNGDNPLVTEEGWVEGEGAKKFFTGTQTNVGSSANSFYIEPNKNLLGKATTDFTNYRFVDSNDKEFTGDYVAPDETTHKIYGEFGTLTVKPRDPENKIKLVIEVDQTGNNEITLPYNGLTQSVDVDITISHKISVEKQTTPAKSTTSEATESTNGQTTDQAFNVIPVSSDDKSLLEKILSFGSIKAYAKDVNEETFSYGDLTFTVAGIKLNGGSGIDVGDYYVHIDLSDLKITMKGDTTDVSDQFDVEVVVPDDVKNNNDGDVVGILHIIPVEYDIHTGSARKVYDGKPLTNSEATITGLVNGETATVKATGSRTEVGSSKNPYELVWDGTAKSTNYVLGNEDLGTLIVDPVGDTPPTPGEPTGPDPDDPTTPDSPTTPDNPTPDTPDTPDDPDPTPDPDPDPSPDPDPTPDPNPGPGPDGPTTPTPGGPIGQVLGATRALLQGGTGEAPAVLGARRGGETDDTTDILGRIITIIVAAGIGFAMIFIKRKKNEEK